MMEPDSLAGDRGLDARGPAFAAVRLWVDVNQDGV